jgi:Tol biopolymer transport system component
VTDGGGDDTITGRAVGDNFQVFGGRSDNDAIFARGGADFIYSADGRKIAFASNRDSNYEIYVLKANGSGTLTGLTNNAAALEIDPAWSPSGTRIAFRSLRDGDHEIFVMKAKPEGKKNRPKNLTMNVVSDIVPDWQPLLP